MSQNYPAQEPSRTDSELPARRDLVAPITATVREEEPLETDLRAVVLSHVANRLPWLSTPDILALRAQFTVDVDEAVPLVERVATIVDAILREAEHWKRGVSQ